MLALLKNKSLRLVFRRLFDCLTALSYRKPLLIDLQLLFKMLLKRRNLNLFIYLLIAAMSTFVLFGTRQNGVIASLLAYKL